MDNDDKNPIIQQKLEKLIIDGKRFTKAAPASSLGEWPEEVKFIIETVNLIEKNSSISNEDLDWFFNEAKEDGDEGFLKFLQDKSIQARIRQEAEDGGKHIFHLENPQDIRMRILKGMTVLTEAISKNRSHYTMIETMDMELLSQTIASLDWIFDKIRYDDNTLRIDQVSGLILNCIIIKSNIAKLTSLFKEVDKTNIMTILAQMPPQQRAGISLKLFNSQIFAKNASLSTKEATVKEIIRLKDSRRIFRPEVLLEVFSNMPSTYKDNFLKKIIPTLELHQSVMIKGLINGRTQYNPQYNSPSNPQPDKRSFPQQEGKKVREDYVDDVDFGDDKDSLI